MDTPNSHIITKWTTVDEPTAIPVGSIHLLLPNSRHSGQQTIRVHKIYSNKSTPPIMREEKSAQHLWAEHENIQVQVMTACIK